MGSLDGVRAGNVIAFGIEGDRGSESLVVVAESKSDDLALVRTICRPGRDGVPPKDIVLVTPGTLPKTSSGKLQRSLCRRRYRDGQLTPATV